MEEKKLGDVFTTAKSTLEVNTFTIISVICFTFTLSHTRSSQSHDRFFVLLKDTRANVRHKYFDMRVTRN